VRQRPGHVADEVDNDVAVADVVVELVERRHAEGDELLLELDGYVRTLEIAPQRVAVGAELRGDSGQEELEVRHGVPFPRLQARPDAAARTAECARRRGAQARQRTRSSIRAGPYGGVPATLTLLRSHTQFEQGRLEPRDLGPTQAIATSTGQSDSGIFELNFRDERYLPFEGAGVHSEWTLSLPGAGNRPFDYDTISDVIVHFRYMARAQTATNHLAADGPTPVIEPESTHHTLLLSVRHDLPRTWSALTGSGDDTVPVPPATLS
jgi:Tc toxin complex TcA C-terminal TcB-binding domain